MCGITGFSWEDKELLRNMTQEIAHRGPDDFGYYTDKGISLGHRRLSILDLSRRGHQPMFNENKDIVVVFNGEIYNFPSLKEDLQKKRHKFASTSDTEVIIHGYEEYGLDICSKLKGMFAFALWDTKKKLLLLARDQIGEKPLYYSIMGKTIIFASEIKALLTHDIARSVNMQALSDYLGLRFSPGEQTIFEGINKLRPGNYLVWKSGNASIKRYYSLPSQSNGKGDANQLRDMMEQVINERLMSDVPLGVFLSGGLDSSAIVSYVSRNVKDLNTFSIGFGDKTDETHYAKLVSDKFQTKHHEIMSSQDEILKNLPQVVWHLDEPLADPASLPLYVLSREVRRKVKVALSGEGGDEVFGGYIPPNVLDKVRKVFSIPHPIRSVVAKTVVKPASSLFSYPHKQMILMAGDIIRSRNMVEGYKKLFYLPFEPKEKKDTICSKNVRYETVFDDLLKDKNSLYNGTYQYYLNHWLPEDLLMKTDKTGMAHALEIRAPFLDKNLIDFSLRLDRRYKHDRALFRQTVKEILPKEVLRRKKQGFTLPLSRWFARKDFLSRSLSHIEDLGNRKLLAKSEIKKIADNPQHFRNDHKIWVLLQLELWCKIYLDKKKLNSIGI
ncbi:asparagine synthase (glutamine-hydrolyzing) [Candidatus Pacearchaeota archaeon]|nr:asparagine synthase (glutamine-hydrolyzing) [Candidatus Pacearchaeota archaeon]